MLYIVKDADTYLKRLQLIELLTLKIQQGKYQIQLNPCKAVKDIKENQLNYWCSYGLSDLARSYDKCLESDVIAFATSKTTDFYYLFIRPKKCIADYESGINVKFVDYNYFIDNVRISFDSDFDSYYITVN